MVALAIPILGVPGLADVVEIGRGGFAIVYRARQVAFSRTVAVKLLARPDLDQQMLRRFQLECEAMGQLSWHPNIVVVHDTGATSAGLPYLIMEFLQHGSLGDRLKRQGPSPWEEVAQVGVQVAGALHAAHQAGLIHRDIKPDNILIGHFREGEAR